jgi:hypothetical protein
MDTWLLALISPFGARRLASALAAVQNMGIKDTEKINILEINALKIMGLPTGS